ncbi:MAG TPA: carbohydrate binding family 9 domain-containing protein, partial [candidate division Zixibacteria bacterium]|nr:carbohydrate binding family 9 domain-containing protein [candidate division Zixibacteria bacterium]
MNTVKLIRARLLVFFFVLSLAPVVLATKTPAPVFNPEITVAKTVKAIKVDGNISPAEWAGAVEISNFVERYPGENTPPAVATQTFVTYDRDNLYVAFVCHDDPTSIRATMCQRDQFNGDDDVCVLIDTYGKAAWAYELLVNPYGVQKDRLWTQVAGEDSGFDMVWASAAKVTDSGYQVEIAVPFASMRFPNQSPQSWKMDFWRNRPRQSSHQYSWAAYNRNEQCWPCQWGEVNGIGDVNPGKGMEILPTYVAHQAGYLNDDGDPTSGFHEGDVSGELSLGAKYSISSNATLEGAYNPDFSQIESDAAQVDVNSTIALFYPERRPFFQEGSDIFRTLFNSFYTRTVNDPQYATKFITRTSDYSIGFMSAEDKNTPYLLPLEERSVLFNSGKSYVNVLRGSRAIGSESRVGFILTDRRLDGGGYGTIASVDGRFRLTQQYSVLGQFISSFTGEPDKAGPSAGLEGVRIDRGKRTAIFDGESFHGNALITQLRRQAREWSFTIDYDQVEPSYRTLTGYDPWVDYRNTFVGTQYNFY